MPLAGLQRTRERVPGVQCFLEHHNGFFYILTNAPTNAISEWSGEGYYLTRCQVDETEESDWQTVFYPDDDVVIQDMDMLDDYLVLSLNKKGLPMLCSIDMPIKKNTKSSIYRVVLSSPVTRSFFARWSTSPSYNSVFPSESPGILMGYGAYGEALDKSWCTNRLSMLDRGWVIAFADVSANYLIDKGYVHRHHLAAIGYSAGSILPAAAMNMQSISSCNFEGSFCRRVKHIIRSKLTSQTTSDPSLAIHRMITYAEMFAIRPCLSQLLLMTQGLEYGKVLNGWLRYGRVVAMIAHEL